MDVCECVPLCQLTGPLPTVLSPCAAWSECENVRLTARERGVHQADQPSETGTTILYYECVMFSVFFI